MFFFEKKNQKTFDSLGAHVRRSVAKKIKVFCFFSSEKKTLLTCFFLVFPVSAAEIKITTWNLNWLTTRTSAEASLPSDVQLRAPEDFVRLSGYAQKLAADVVAFQEVDGQAAAAAVFDPKIYTILTIDENVVQRVGIAVRKSILVSRNPDLTALDVEPAEKFPLRDGLDVTLGFPGGAKLRALVVHLKNGCQTDSMRRSERPQCALLLRQIEPLAAWVAARRAEGGAFVVLGDFNRVFDEKEELGEALAGAAPLVRVTEGYENPCWNGAPFIDHIFLGGAARGWLRPESLRVQIFREVGDVWRKRLSDHCPVSVRLEVPNGP
jgi:endonuclease/exonuclease/phosphatase family metal-dependent hydrolase